MSNPNRLAQGAPASAGGQYTYATTPPAGVELLDAQFCYECGDSIVIEADGVSHHVDEHTGQVDYDKDADHVAFGDEPADVPATPAPGLEPRVWRERYEGAWDSLGSDQRDEYRARARQVQQNRDEHERTVDGNLELREHDYELGAMYAGHLSDDEVTQTARRFAGARRGPMCDRCDGRWGYDLTCEQCCTEDGDPRDIPEKIDPRYWRQRASEHRRASADSFDRSDTDGFATQAANDIKASQYLLQAQICEDGGAARHPALFTVDGEPVAAKLVTTQYGTAFALLSSDDPDSPFTGTFVNPSKAATAAKRDAALARKGYRMGYVWASSRADLTDGGSGFAGMASVRPYARRTDGGFDRNAELASWDTDDAA